MSSRAIDNQLNAFISICALNDSKPNESVALNIIFDNEETGSETVQGAESAFTKIIMQKIAEGLSLNDSAYKNMIPNSFILSADNGHSVHPGYPEQHNPVVRTYLGKGVILKRSASYNYTTNGITAAIVRKFAEKNNVKTQELYGKIGVISGSTLAKHLSPTINICRFFGE